MAMLRRGSSKGSRNGTEKEDEDAENNGYVQIFVKPLDGGEYNIFLGWLGLSKMKLSSQQIAMLYGLAVLTASVLLYQILTSDLGILFHRLCAIIVPIFSITCIFYWIALYYRKTWSNTSVYLLFGACYSGEFVGQCLVSTAVNTPAAGGGEATADSAGGDYIVQPVLAFLVLLAVSVASIFSTLETAHSTVVIVVVSFVRYLACTSLVDLPSAARPFIAYTGGVSGVIVAKYMETIFTPAINNLMTQDGKIPVIKRRRSSSSTAHSFSNHRAGRRTSLPALIHKPQSSTLSYESAIIGEAHGLITDMLADTSLPPHVVSGLRAVSNLLKPPDPHAAQHKPKVSPLVSLTESNNYGSDNEDSPFTGERPSSLPKRLRRSLPPSLIRRMSASTWTTTTSATGLPTLELEPCRTRSSSFRHARDGATPGASPAASRSNSPSPSSPTTVSLIIPKTRSFSIATTTPYSPPVQKRTSRDRKSLHLPNTQMDSISPSKSEKSVSPLVIGEVKVEEERGKVVSMTMDSGHPSIQRVNISSDYESSDSPSNSDHSDNIMGIEDGAVMPRPNMYKESKQPSTTTLNTSVPALRRSVSVPQEDELKHRQGELPHIKSAIIKKDQKTIDSIDGRDDSRITHVQPQPQQPATVPVSLPYDLSDLEVSELLTTQMLNMWDYPIFELAKIAPTSVLSRMVYKIFLETGLFETFRIPLPEFLNFFHALELGYREKPYHNRVHAADVLHACYYMTTQPVPGFTHVNPEGDLLNTKHNSSSESDSESNNRVGHCHLAAHRAGFSDDSYGIMGGNFPPLELMALYASAAMHDYDHPGRTNAFLVDTLATQAVLYNDRSVLENYHAASSWRLFLSDPKFNWLQHLDKTEFKRFRFLVIEAILATDLKRHFEFVAEFNAKVNVDDAPGIDWTSEADRLLTSNMVIKLADINGPTKIRDLHVSWTMRITEEFYEQGDEELGLGLNISPYMDRNNPQLAKLQESFINHLVAPLCNAVAAAGLLPGTWVENDSDPEGLDLDLSDTDKGDSTCKDTEDETDQESDISTHKKPKANRKVDCILTKHLKDNYDSWIIVLNEEKAKKEAEKVSFTDGKESSMEKDTVTEMEPITEEDLPPSPKNLDDSQSTDSSTTTNENQSQEKEGDQSDVSTVGSNQSEQCEENCDKSMSPQQPQKE